MANRNLTFSLAYNLVSEVADSVERLYHQNSDFEHLIVDCGFPLIKDEIPDNIEAAKEFNTGQLIELANDYNCDYLRINNKGVSQNWNQIIEYLEPDDSDILIGVDCDEHAVEHGWIKALCDVLRADESLGYAAPCLIDAVPILSKNTPIKAIGGYRVYDMWRMQMNYGFLGIKQSFINKIGGKIPIPNDMEIYGGIEKVLLEKIREHNMNWVILADYTQGHTNNCKLYRAWKDDAIFERSYKGKTQITFEKWLETEKLKMAFAK